MNLTILQEYGGNDLDTQAVDARPLLSSHMAWVQSKIYCTYDENAINWRGALQYHWVFNANY